MSTTVYEALMNAQINFKTIGRMGAYANPIYVIAMEQLDNALDAIRNGNGLDYVIQEQIFGPVSTGLREREK